MRNGIDCLSSALSDACRSLGVAPPSSLPVLGRWAEADIDGDPHGRGDARIKLFLDGEGGIVHNWKSGEQQAFFAGSPDRLTPEQKAIRRQAIESARLRAEEELRQEQEQAAQKAKAIYEAGSTGIASHPYASKKGVPLGPLVRRGSWPQRGWPDALLIPLYNADGKLRTLEAINGDGGKDFLKGGEKRGCFYPLGKIRGASVIAIGEGVATVAACHSDSLPVVAAMDKGNLIHVAREVKKLAPDAAIIFLADNDMKPDGSNPGLSAANEAAMQIGGRVAVPDLGRPCDFWDVWKEHGTEAIERAIANAIAPAMGECSDSGGKQENALEADVWPDPLPIPDALPDVPAFDFALLPESLRPWIEDIAERVQCPPDFPAVGAMVSLSAVVGRKIGIRPKRRDDWLEVPNLWGAIIGRPGVMKSPALRESMRPLRKLETLAAEQFAEESRAWKQARELAKLKREADRANIVKAYKTGKAINPEALADDFGDDEPQARRYVVNDCSVEALGEILRHNPNGTLAYRDELVGLLKSLDREGNEGARGFFLSAWSGTDGYTFDRIGRGLNMRIEACCLSLLGSIQPSVIGGYLRQAVAGGGADGLLSRFQLMVWPDISADWKDVDRFPETAAGKKAAETFDQLDALEPSNIGANVEDGDIPYLRFDDAAQELFSEWRAPFEGRIRSGEDHAAFESHLSKYRKLVPSLALLCHLADNSGAAVGETALLKALAWVDYLEAHARRAYASVTQAEAEGARALLYRIRRREVADLFAPRDIYLKHWACLGTPEATHEAVRLLCDLDYLREERTDTRGRPKVEFRINPKARSV